MNSISCARTADTSIFESILVSKYFCVDNIESLPNSTQANCRAMAWGRTAAQRERHHVKPFYAAIGNWKLEIDNPSAAMSEDGDDVLDRDDKKLVARLEVDGNRTLRIEEHLVVLADGKVFLRSELNGNSNDPAGEDGNLKIIREGNTSARGFLVFVLADENSLADGLHGIESVPTRTGITLHGCS
jgi:hypothetical protein